MLDILTIVHSFADIQTASRLRRTCRRLGALTTRPILYKNPSDKIEYEYRIGSKLHRLDGPARVCIYGSKHWYRGGIEHREYHPQFTDVYSRKYMVDGVCHAEVGPSIIGSVYGDLTWGSRGLLHRKVGPARGCIIREWYTLGKLHRLDGPAYIKLYIIRGKRHRISAPMGGAWLVEDVIIRI